VTEKIDTTPFIEDIIVKTTARILLPLILLWALYVLIHGAGGPGGGFQAGCVLAAGLILFTIAFGLKETKRIFTIKWVTFLSSLGVMIYAGTGLACLFFGGKFLEYGRLPFPEPVMGPEYGIESIEIGVGITVMAVMISIFYDLALKKD
jgi:multicomponent Na+:H+ antiporter subunit B